MREHPHGFRRCGAPVAFRAQRCSVLPCVVVVVLALHHLASKGNPAMLTELCAVEGLILRRQHHQGFLVTIHPGEVDREAKQLAYEFHEWITAAITHKELVAELVEHRQTLARHCVHAHAGQQLVLPVDAAVLADLLLMLLKEGLHIRVNHPIVEELMMPAAELHKRFLRVLL